jgi:hypothetical protein
VGQFELIDADRRVTLDPRPGYAPNDCPTSSKALYGIKRCIGPSMHCGRTDGGPASPADVKGVSLID